MKKIYAVLFGVILMFGMPSSPAFADDHKVTICHVAGLAEDPANTVTLTLPKAAVFKDQGGHFYENGTPQAGHEQDYLGPCEVEPTPTPTPTETPTETPSPSETPSPTPTEKPSVTPTPSETPTETPTPTDKPTHPVDKPEPKPTPEYEYTCDGVFLNGEYVRPLTGEEKYEYCITTGRPKPGKPGVDVPAVDSPDRPADKPEIGTPVEQERTTPKSDTPDPYVTTALPNTGAKENGIGIMLAGALIALGARLMRRRV